MKKMALKRKTIFFSLLTMACAYGLNNLEKFKIEESSNLFPETEFNTYDRPELEIRSIIRDYDSDELELVEIGKRKVLYKRSSLNATEIAKQFMEQNYPNIEYIFTNILDYDDESDIASIHMSQAINGVEIANTAININIDKLSGSIISTGVSIWENIETTNSAVGVQPMDLIEAINIVRDNLELSTEEIDGNSLKIEKTSNNYFKVKGIPFTHDGSLMARKIYTGVSSTKAEEIWEITAEIDIDFYVICVSIESRTVVQINNITHHVTYRVVPLNKPNIGSAKREEYIDPFIQGSSPLGWHNDGVYQYQDTRGNNIHVIENSDGDDSIENNVYISGGEDMRFVFNYEGNKEKIEGNQAAAAANVFYLTNLLHDVFFKLGFTEGYGNFQYENFSGKGKGGDPVYVIISDRNGKNNAQMSTPVDGKPPKLRLYPFTFIDGPERDPSFDNEIIIHEYTHGVTQRLTGGQDTVDCLKGEESKGLNEGWSDFFANALQFRKNRNRYTPLELFRYVLDEEHGRKYPITSDMDINPLMYSDLSYNEDEKFSPYKACEIWSVMLHEIFWNVVEVYKNLPEFYKKEYQRITYAPSNYIVMKIVVDGMKLQPCNPTFISARDSIITAVKNFNGSNTKLLCLFWKGFATRGLGLNAKGKTVKNNKTIYSNDYTVPEECKSYFTL